MPIRNHRPDLSGVLNLDKPLHMTSATACAAIRRITGGAKVGHAGTLDPLATGVLVVCLGKATKLVPQLMGAPKRYLAHVDLSAFSTTDDMEGEETIVDVPAGHRPSRAAVEAACRAFVGPIMQTPPIYSALKVGGRAAYKRARAGEAMNLAPRPVVIHSIEVTDYAWPLATLDIRCGKGTYIRSLARDLGAALKTGGRLAALRRTAVGPFTADAALELEGLTNERIEASVLAPAAVCELLASDSGG